MATPVAFIRLIPPRWNGSLHHIMVSDILKLEALGYISVVENFGISSTHFYLVRRENYRIR